MAAQVCGPPRLDVVDVLTPMDLATLYDGTEDVAALWHRVREEIGVEDEGTGEERSAAIEKAARPRSRSSTQSPTAPVACSFTARTAPSSSAA